MEAYLIGNNLTPDPSPKGERSYETSLTVTQWMELVRGERAVKEPSNPFRVEAVREGKLYCLLCCGVWTHDVIVGWQVSGARCQVKRCRMCGKEGVI